ncbi:MAG TPA: glycosyltransferase family 2 protein [bacterium]
MTIDYSIVIPVYNEEKNIEDLHSKILKAMSSINSTFEVIYVDDGSYDKGMDVLLSISKNNPDVKVVQFAKNFGQTAAISAGAKHSRGDIIILIDCDLQNDPDDIPRLIEKIKEGYDLVSGWRKKRKDPWFTRRLPSVIANFLISFVTRVKLHDFGCTLKAYRRGIFEGISLYGEMHRLMPVYASWRGARITELIVKHNPRTAGRSKYGIGRTFKVLLDLFAIMFFGSYSTKPIYFFGGFGIFMTVCSVISGIVVLVEKYYLPDAPAHRNPLLLLAVFLFLIGFQMVMMGLLAEILMRTYFEVQDKPTYVIKSKVNF